MFITILVFVVIVALVLIAFRVGVASQEQSRTDKEVPVIHTSGIYSVIRRSPRESIEAKKPSEQEIRKYLSTINVNRTELRISEKQKIAILEKWNQTLKEQLTAIENGDNEGVEFYYYDFPSPCIVCQKHIMKGQFVTREEIFKYPSIVPPLHLGCNCKLVPYAGNENLRDTTEIGMRPLFSGGTHPALPDWKQFV